MDLFQKNWPQSTAVFLHLFIFFEECAGSIGIIVVWVEYIQEVAVLKCLQLLQIFSICPESIDEGSAVLGKI